LTFKCERTDLWIIASPKGLIGGNLFFKYNGINYDLNKHGFGIPPDIDNMTKFNKT
jgi:DNA topoisomerase VI subunit A